MNRLVDKESSDIFLLVFGTQRSGTTLLCRMLSAHPELFIQNLFSVCLVRRVVSHECEDTEFGKGMLLKVTKSFQQ